MVTPAKPTLYVYQHEASILTSWEKEPEVTTYPINPKEHVFKWRTDVLVHPEVTIYVGKSRNERSYNHSAIAHACMVALQDATIAVAPLRRERKEYTRRRVEEPTFVTLQMFPE